MSTGTDFATTFIRMLESICRTFTRREHVACADDGPELSGRATRIVHWPA